MVCFTFNEQLLSWMDFLFVSSGLKVKRCIFVVFFSSALIYTAIYRPAISKLRILPIMQERGQIEWLEVSCLLDVQKRQTAPNRRT